MMTQAELHDSVSQGVRAHPKPVPQAIIWLATGVLAYFTIKVSWLAEDAYITLRTVDNLLKGHGLRWNVAERVQVFTHPLWLFVLVPFKAIIPSSILALMVPGWLTALPTFPLLFRAARTPPGVVVAFCALVLSQSVIDFSTSGLETSLSHLLIVCILITLPSERGGITQHALFFGLLLLNRLDLLPLVAPLVLVELWRAGGHRRPLRVLLGLSPLIAWLVFASVYYGSPLPNTYFAKVAANMPPGSIALQGLRYFLDLCLYEPLTLASVLCGLALGVRGRRVDRASYCLALGIGLHVLYVFKVGGDYMNARFLTPDVVAAAWITLRAVDRRAASGHPSWAESTPAMAAIAAVAVALIVADHHSFASRKSDLVRATTISDERQVYLPATGLWSRLWGYLRGEPFEASHPWVDLGRRLRREHPRGKPFVHLNMGLLGYYAGRRIHIVDALGLTDPFVARLPVDEFWTAGHAQRVVPEQYIQSLSRRRNVIENPGLHHLFDDLTLATRSEDLFSTNRFWACWRLNTGYDYGRVSMAAAAPNESADPARGR
jgi:arabinofuranosyltransferase